MVEASIGQVNLFFAIEVMDVQIEQASSAAMSCRIRKPVL